MRKKVEVQNANDGCNINN